MKDTRHMGTCRAQQVEWRQWEVRAAMPWGRPYGGRVGHDVRVACQATMHCSTLSSWGLSSWGARGKAWDDQREGEGYEAGSSTNTMHHVLPRNLPQHCA